MTAHARPLRLALIVTLAAHAAAMLAMAALLLPGMPGGPHGTVAARAAYVAGHPVLWRAGWAAWQATVASNLAVSVALLMTPWVPRMPAVLAVVASVAGLVPEQVGEAMWAWRGVRLAGHDVGAYAALEFHALRLVAGYGTVGHLAAALCWTGAFAAAGTWSRRLTGLSAVLWPLFAAATATVFWPAPPAWVDRATSAANAVAFVLLLAWLAAVTGRVWRQGRGRRHATILA